MIGCLEEQPIIGRIGRVVGFGFPATGDKHG
jgi:hypothetical protein